MRRSPTVLTTLLLALLLALPAAPSARAAFLPGVTVDGPSAGIAGEVDIDIARDGTGAVAWVKSVDGVRHVYLSLLTNGAYGPPELLDAGTSVPGGAPVVAATDGGRVAVAFTSGTDVGVRVRYDGTRGFGPQQTLGPGAAPSADMSINGGAYVTFTSPSGDVRAAHLERASDTFVLLPDVVDVNAVVEAGSGTGRSTVAVAADGTGVVAWGEGGHVYARRLFGQRISATPQDLTLPDLAGSAGGAADLPDIDVEDDSSFAWAVFRQVFADGRAHAITRRLVGSAFEAPVQVDGFGFPGGDDVTGARIAMSGRGVGLAAISSAAFGSFGAILRDDAFDAVKLLTPGNAVPPHAVAGIGENNVAYAFQIRGTSAADAAIAAIPFRIDPAKRVPPPVGAAGVVSDPALGPVDPAAGLDLSVNRAGDANGVWVQGTGENRRVVVGGFDRPPGAFTTYTAGRVRNLVRPTLSWGKAFELQGAISYRVEVDGQILTTTGERRYAPVAPLADGTHPWRVVAIDGRGQETPSAVRYLRVDATKPEAQVSVSGVRKRGRLMTVAVRAADGSLAAPKGSGVKRVRIDFGDGTVVDGRTATHRYPRGRFTIRVSATDVAGNATVVTRSVQIAK